ncbi:IPT/TIG domain-containing protein [Chloroflexota bacterium]
MRLRTEGKHIKYHKSMLIFLLAVSLSLLVTMAAPVAPVLAQPSISLSPVSGYRGTNVTVTGTGFSGGQDTYVDLYFGSFKIKDIEIPQSGTFTTDFNVPSYVTPGTAYKVTIHGGNGLILAEEWFIVGARMNLEPNKGEVGKSVKIDGFYFDANKEVRLYFSSDAADVGDNIDDEVSAYEYMVTVSTDSEGRFDSPYLFSIPSQLTDGADTENVYSGDYYIYASDFSGGKRIRAVAKFIVTSDVTQSGAITMSPVSGYRGVNVTVTGTGFSGGQDTYVELYFGNFKIKEIEIPQSGTFTTNFNVPSYVTPGIAYQVTIHNEKGVVLAENSFIVAAKINLSYDKGEVGKWVTIDGFYFDANEEVHLYFSSDTADVGDNIDDVGDNIDGEVSTYEYIGTVSTNSGGRFDSPCYFPIPGQLTDGADMGNIYRGDYYVYATYSPSGDSIRAVTKFFVVGIELYPTGGTVGTQVEISGEDLRDNQEITITYDGNNIETVSGDNKIDSDGKFKSVINIPESTAGDHAITVIVGAGFKYAAPFSVKPRIALDPTLAVAGEAVTVSGNGFDAPYYESDCVIITIDAEEIHTSPPVIRTGPSGNFSGSFTIPSDFSYTLGGTYTVSALSNNLNKAETQLTIENTLPTPANISLNPITSSTSPGHVGMEITADGGGFIANTEVTITYDNGESSTLATATSDDNGNYSATFSIPPSIAGEHTVTCTDGTNSATSTFIMESEAPAPPVKLLSQVDTTPETKVHFDWEDIKDPSGVAYVFQFAADPDFKNVLLEKDELTSSEYTLTKEAGIGTIKEGALYYWRVKAVDGASNNSRWAYTKILRVETSQTESSFTIPTWAYGIAIGLGLILSLLAIRIFASNK